MNIPPTERTGFRVSSVDDLLVLVASGPTSPADMSWLEGRAQEFAVPRPGRAVYLHHVPKGTEQRLPDEETRTAMQRFMRNASVNYVAAALVLDVAGFFGAAMRSLFSGLILIARPSIPVKTFATVAEARVWLARLSPASRLPNEAALSAALAELEPKR